MSQGVRAVAVERALQAGMDMVDPAYGIVTDITISQSLPDEPPIFTTKVERNHPEELTDGHSLPPLEGGCSIKKEKALLSGLGEAVERYCACIYRNADLQEASYESLDSALNPARVTNFSARQQNSGSLPGEVYETGDKLRWERANRLSDGTATFVPAQLTYLNYDNRNEPLIRNPISTGLAASTNRHDAVIRASLEVAERDAFMIYYLTETELPHIQLPEPSGDIRLITERLDRAGLDWHLFDARTDTGVPIVIAVLIADEVPTVTVSAAAHSTAHGAVRDALEEAIQIRLYQRHLISAGSEPVDLVGKDDESIGRDTRLLGWAGKSAAKELTFWLESTRRTTLDTMASRKYPDRDQVPDMIDQTLEQYVVDLTTCDVSEAGFNVVRVIAPDAQPLYLRESIPYLDTARLDTVPEHMGYNSGISESSSLNNYPHPFS